MKLNGSIAKAGFINDLVNRGNDLASMGYFPGNFGWVSVVLKSAKVSPYYIDEFNNRYYPFEKPLTALKGCFVLLTRKDFPIRAMNYSRSKTQEFLGIVRISPTGDSFQLMWGFFRQELDFNRIYQQLFVHNEALIQNKSNDIVAYCSPNYLQQYSYFCDNDDFKLTADLWKSFPHLASLTPKGIGSFTYLKSNLNDFLNEIKIKLEMFSVVLIKHEGVIISGSSWNDILNLATSLDHSAQAALTINDLKNQVSAQELVNIVGENILNPEIINSILNEEENRGTNH